MRLEDFTIKASSALDCFIQSTIRYSNSCLLFSFNILNLNRLIFYGFEEDWNTILFLFLFNSRLLVENRLKHVTFLHLNLYIMYCDLGWWIFFCFLLLGNIVNNKKFVYNVKEQHDLLFGMHLSRVTM